MHKEMSQDSITRRVECMSEVGLYQNCCNCMVVCEPMNIYYYRSLPWHTRHLKKSRPGSVCESCFKQLESRSK
jgi:hypothetical protein